MIRLAAACVSVAAVMCGDPALAQVGLPVSVATTTPGTVAAMPSVDIELQFHGPVFPRLEVIRLVRIPGESPWTLAELAHIQVAGAKATLRGSAGLDTLLLMRGAAEAGYLTVGPFRWPTLRASIDVPIRWRRTVRGRWPGISAGALVWVARPDDGGPSSWPMCVWLDNGEWECVGVPLHAAGVVVSTDAGQTRFAFAPGPSSSSGIEAANSSSAGWGRLLVIGRADRVPVSQADSIVVAARKLQVPRLRQPPSRVQTEADGRIRVERIAEGVYWVSGREPFQETWIEITAAGRAPARFEISTLASASGEIPVQVDLDDAASIVGRVTGAGGAVAPGAIVTLYRLVADLRSDRRRPPRRVTVGETISDEDGAFRFRDVAREPLELMAMHRELGRAEQTIDADSHDVQLVLRAPSRATGRVVRDGVPAAGIPVTTVPDLAEFAAADDVTELAGGDTETDTDGRFSVSMPPRGRVELRVGVESTGVRRVVLGSADSLPRLVDVGTIDLSPLPRLTLVLEESSGCELILAGPMGRAGVTIHRATRLGASMYEARLPESGQWLVTATCAGGQSRTVAPQTVDMAEGAGERTVHLLWK